MTISGASATAVNTLATAITWSISGTITGGSGATVTLSGKASATVTADASGNYSFLQGWLKWRSHNHAQQE